MYNSECQMHCIKFLIDQTLGLKIINNKHGYAKYIIGSKQILSKYLYATD